MIWFNGFPFLDNKEEHSFGVPVSAAMTSFVMTLPATGATLSDIERLLASSPYQGFPIVATDALRDRSNILVGYIGRTELRYVLDRAQANPSIPPDAACTFVRPETTSTTTMTPPASAVPPTPITPAIRIAYDALTRAATVDLSRFVDPTPLAVHPRLPLETAMELFKKMGPRVILVEHHGRLAGLVTVKDCLKYQFTAEPHDSPRDAAAGQERLWRAMRVVAAWVARRLERLSSGRIRLRDDDSRGGERRGAASAASRNGDAAIAAAVGDEGSNVELEARSPQQGPARGNRRT